LGSDKYENVLIFGGGTGKLLIELLKRNIAENYCYVDISDKMILLTKKRLKKNFPDKVNSVQFICGSYTDIESEKKFDAIFTPYILDCFKEEELSVVMDKLDTHLSIDGKWFFSDFNIPSTKMKSISTILVRMLYFMFNVICGLGIKKLPDFRKEFSRLKYSLIQEKYFLKEMIVSRVYGKGS
jgi:2-polyprenyl-3-methyl-5-hydroxy-6-metoxy-1,4-benzoquinol methylase